MRNKLLSSNVSCRTRCGIPIQLRETPQRVRGDKGFTLIEISIVIVIIGLVVGGVLEGADLIHQAQLKAIISEKQKLETAVTSFQTKYACLPGDCAKATTFFPATTANGNGNGVIEFYSNPGTEAFSLFDHLQQAGLWSGVPNPLDNTTYRTNGVPAALPGYNIPASKYPNIGYIMGYIAYSGSPTQCDPTNAYTQSNFIPDQCGKTLMIFGASVLASGQYNWWVGGQDASSGIPCSDIMALETKYDDGMPDTGKIQIGGPNAIGSNCYNGSYPNRTYYSSSSVTVPILFITDF